MELVLVNLHLLDLTLVQKPKSKGRLIVLVRDLKDFFRHRYVLAR